MAPETKYYTWREVSGFIRFAIYSIITLSAAVAAWTALGFPLPASQAYVNNKVIQIEKKLDIIPTIRIQLNKMTRQSLEREKWRLTNQAKTDNSFDVQRRLLEVEQELEDTAQERRRLLGN